MSDNQEIQGFRERLEAILEALERLPGRFADIRTPQDFIATEAGREHLDSISMVLGVALLTLDIFHKKRHQYPASDKDDFDPSDALHIPH